VPEEALSVAKITPHGVATNPATPAQLGSFGANPVPEGALSVEKITPDGVTTSPGSVSGEVLAVDQDHGQDAHATETPCGVPASPAEERLCETKPISGGG